MGFGSIKDLEDCEKECVKFVEKMCEKYDPLTAIAVHTKVSCGLVRTLGDIEHPVAKVVQSTVKKNMVDSLAKVETDDSMDDYVEETIGEMKENESKEDSGLSDDLGDLFDGRK